MEEKRRITAEDGPMADIKTHCTCESCAFLSTSFGEVIMHWARVFIKECQAAIKDGADPEKVMAINMNGPSRAELKDGFLRARGMSYLQFEFSIGMIAGLHGRHTAMPDFDVLIEAYADDPVLRTTLMWMKERYG